MRITTTLVHNNNGTPKIVAKGNGKQRTVNYDLSLSADRNHGLAAGTLALVLIKGEAARHLAAKTATHTTKDGGKHVFTIV